MKGITKPCDIQIGNSVLKKTDRKENKLTPSYEPNPYAVTNKKDLESFLFGYHMVL
jgi:hypothetical protein